MKEQRATEVVADAPVQRSAAPAPVLDVQRSAGNRAVGALVARQAKQRKPTATRPPRRTIVVVPDRPLTPHEFAVLVAMRLNRTDRAQAEAIVALAIEAHGRAGIGRIYERGVSQAEVGKPIEVVVAAPDAQSAPDDDEVVLRIADKLARFTAEDWQLYRRRSNGATRDYAQVEASIDRFMARRASESTSIRRVSGTERLYQQVKDFEALERGMLTPRGRSDRLPIDEPGNRREYEAAKASVAAALSAAGFANSADYRAACGEYLRVFRARAVELAMLALRASEQNVEAERSRYRQAGEVADLHARLATMRRLTDEADASARESVPNPESFDLTELQQRALQEYLDKSKQAEGERMAQAGPNPILMDPELRTGELNVRDPGALGEVLRGNAADRLSDIRSTRAKLLEQPELVFELDRIVALTLQELGSGPGSIGDLIVADHRRVVRARELVIRIALSALAIGLGLLTFGGGTVAVIAGAGGLALSGYQAVEEIDRFRTATAAAHTAFDPELSVASNEPSAVWIAVALVGLGLDAAAVASALKAAGPALKVLEATDDVARFEAELAKAGRLSEELKAFLAQAARARAIKDAAQRRAAFADLQSQVDVQQSNLALVARLRTANPTMSKRQIADLAAPHIRVPRVPFGMDAGEFERAQAFIRSFLHAKGVTGAEGFATGSRVTGVGFNAKQGMSWRTPFGEAPSNWAKKDFDITIITPTPLKGWYVKTLKERFKLEFGYELGLRPVTPSELRHLPIYGKLDLDLK